jgi:ACS family hexuronate transporter-like MFS transporter
MNPAATDSRRRWIVCGLLLLASAINYMDRQTLANAAVRVTREFDLSQQQYGQLEAWFGYAFAAGSLGFGVLADRLPLRWLYAVVVLLWSAVGLATGFATTHSELLLCRTLLGLCEGGHWPCAIKATRALLDERDRSLGNGVLQSGTSIGAMITPLIMSALLTPEPGSWRFAFQVVGAFGLVWIALWLWVVRDRDFAAPPDPGKQPSLAGGVAGAGSWGALARLVCSRRMLVIFVVIACINTTWQILRAWLPKILQEGRGWSESTTLFYNAGWFAATDVGCLGAGFLAVRLARRGWTVHGARVAVFGGCGVAVALCAFVPALQTPWMLGALLLVIGGGALGMFPLYHAFTQDLSGPHQGRITGIASVAAWILPALAQPLFGGLADRTGSFDTGLVAAGFLPLVAWLAIWIGWPTPARPPAGPLLPSSPNPAFPTNPTPTRSRVAPS